ncbi:sensor histidine kinase [Amphritea sp.]|uniref:sensor histidine kinase n=1 Tax=Amphritea sp. TaxID=1872502 RepID=UPI003A93D98B
MSEAEAYKAAYQREKQARLEAEQLLEVKTRNLFLANQQLRDQNTLLKNQQALLIRTEKLATLGTLAAGVAHEINNPLAFVLSNMDSLKRYVEAYNALLQLGRNWLTEQQLTEQQAIQLQTLITQQDLDFICEDVAELLSDTDQGLIRLRDIVQGLRNFSHGGNTERTQYNLNEGLDSTLKILQSELKNNIKVNCQLADIPATKCNPGELNQVFLNLIMNACHALSETQDAQIDITTDTKDDCIVIHIKDNGSGIPETVLKSIFDPFFTTKPVGQGTGMGLSIAYGIIQDHKGSINVTSTEGQGSCFEIHLPVEA